MLKGQSKNTRSKPVIDLETILMGQQQKIELGSFFAYELRAVPPALIDGQGCLRKCNKYGLVKRIGVVAISPKSADTIIVDVPLLFYHIIRPLGGSLFEVFASIEERLSKYTEATSKKIVVFDKYHDISAKDHERMRRASETVIDYDLSIASLREMQS